ncbi:Phosphopentomutase [Buchnera aphidicola (Eriosoma grossulariae)]|uniref:phosphopentomutase n=1 Tax=Buchnera aphidicola TaxID=9 RepID=UPI003464BFFB
MNRVVIMLLDSFGIGSSTDAFKFNDEGANTFKHIYEMCFLKKANHGRQGPLNIPNLISLGLGKLMHRLTGSFPIELNFNIDVIASYAYASSISSGKDTLSGHFEIMGVPILTSWDRFLNKKSSIPEELLENIISHCNIPGIIGNCHSSGITILQQFGEEHIHTGKPIFYTSMDSVIQIACHENFFGLNNLYKLSCSVRNILNNTKYNIGRVIARPFLGNNKKEFTRTNNRKDYSIAINERTVMEKLILEKHGEVIGIGKISDIFSGRGITQKIPAYGLADLFEKTNMAIDQAKDNSIIFTNFVDFDSVWGHRRDVSGYAKGLEFFDLKLLNIINKIQKKDLLIITADHGCDPTWIGSEHTREFIPILLYRPGYKSHYLGHRNTFSDIAQTISQYFSLSSMHYGTSMI